MHTEGLWREVRSVGHLQTHHITTGHFSKSFVVAYRPQHVVSVYTLLTIILAELESRLFSSQAALKVCNSLRVLTSWQDLCSWQGESI